MNVDKSRSPRVSRKSPNAGNDNDEQAIGSHLEIQIEASNLANMDVFSLSDPFALLESWDDRKWVELGKLHESNKAPAAGCGPQDLTCIPPTTHQRNPLKDLLDHVLKLLISNILGIVISLPLSLIPKSYDSIQQEERRLFGTC